MQITEILILSEEAEDFGRYKLKGRQTYLLSFFIYCTAPQQAVQLVPQHAWQPPAAVQFPLGQLLPHAEVEF